MSKALPRTWIVYNTMIFSSVTQSLGVSIQKDKLSGRELQLPESGILMISVDTKFNDREHQYYSVTLAIRYIIILYQLTITNILNEVILLTTKVQ